MFSLETTIAGHTLIHKATRSKCLCLSQDKESAVICPTKAMQDQDSGWILHGGMPAIYVSYEEIDRQFESTFEL